ncbi:MAG: hypothetical protein ABJN14_15800 [Paracoccaceae bacterium]
MKTLMLLVFMSWPFQSLACIGLRPQADTFFLELPAALEGQPFVARVKILGAGESTPAPVGTTTVAGVTLRFSSIAVLGRNVPVLVTDGIRGASKGEVLEVHLYGGSRARHCNTEVGSERYIAGTLYDGVFVGTWREVDILDISND